MTPRPGLRSPSSGDGDGHHAVGRLGVPMDTAKGILFLASADAGYMNGAGLIVDGGLTAT